MLYYYQDEWVTQFCSDALEVIPGLPDESVDLLCTDPPYGISFMGKEWDKALPDIRVWKECFRVLKPGAFAFVMSIPRADCLSRMIISLEDAGFRVDFSPIFWTYASGFPKAQNIGKAVDKRLGAERTEGQREWRGGQRAGGILGKNKGTQTLRKFDVPATPQAKALDGSYGGFQPKPAVEVIIVAMKPLSEKTFVDQALKNGKGITWLDDCRVPHGEPIKEMKAQGLDTGNQTFGQGGRYEPTTELKASGRFPANLLVSDDVLNDGRVIKGGKPCNQNRQGLSTNQVYGQYNKDITIYDNPTDSGSFSRYFDLDKFFEGLLDKLKSKAYNKDKNTGDTQWEVSQAGEQNGLKSKPIPASGADGNSPTTPATELTNAASVQNPAMPTSGSVGQSQDVKSVEERLDYTETDIAQRLAQIKLDTETLLETITKNNGTPTEQRRHSLLSQSVANYVVSKLQDLRDIIQTIINQPRLFGSVVPAIIEQMRQDLSHDQLWQNFWQERSALLTESQLQTYPFAIISKASKSEKNKGLGDIEPIQTNDGRNKLPDNAFQRGKTYRNNSHPTVKPLKLMSYLITLGSRPGDTILDPYSGSGTTLLAGKLLNRRSIGIDDKKAYCEIAAKRCSQGTLDLSK